MELRLEKEKDYRENEILTREAFWNVYRPGCNEHLVHHNLRKSATFIPELNYVAVQNKKIIGNIVYVKMLQNGVINHDIIGFGPVSVHPQMQRQGVGSKLITESLQKAKELGYKAVLITGNPSYYSRFGFVPASRFHIHLPDISPDEEAPFFMAKELESGFLAKHSGIYDFDSAYNPSDSELEEFDKDFSPKKKRQPLPSDL